MTRHTPLDPRPRRHAYRSSHPHGLQGAPCRVCGQAQARHWPWWRRVVDWLAVEMADRMEGRR